MLKIWSDKHKMSSGNIFPGKQNKPNAEVFNKILELNLAWTYLSATCRGHLKLVETQRVSNVKLEKAGLSTRSRATIQGSKGFGWILVA